MNVYRTALVLVIINIITPSFCKESKSDRNFHVTHRQHAREINEFAQKYRKSSNEGSPSVRGATRASLLIHTEVLRGVQERAAVALAAVKENERNVSATCQNHTQLLLEAVQSGEDWALRMVDAMGKPESGALDLHLTWLGSWEECVAVQALEYEDPHNQTGPSSPFTGQYCMTYFYLGQQPDAILVSPVLTLGIAMCLPSTCDTDDVTLLVPQLESLLQINTTGQPPPGVMCQPHSLEYTRGDIIVLVICSLFAAVIAVSTLYDIGIDIWLNGNKSSGKKKPINSNKGILGDSFTATSGRHKGSPLFTGTGSDEGIERSMTVDEQTPLIASGSDTGSREKPVVDVRSETFKPGLLGKLLLSFSVYTNAPKIFNTKQPPGTLTAVHGIRFISMTWVILGHTYSTGINLMENPGFIPDMTSRLSFQAIGNATFSVDTFFVLSGLLVSYLSLKELKKRGGMLKFNWGMYYFHRFWRLTPPYMLVLLVYSTLILHFANGPLWPTNSLDPCAEKWWHNLLYINNLVDPDKMCMGWSWYLANDMQFFVITPILLIPLYNSSLWGCVSCLALVLVNFISAGLISKHYELDANMLLGANVGDSFTEMYVKPWCRVGAYTVGVFTGYILYKTKCQVKMSKILNAIGWLVATAVALLILYGLWSPDNKETLSVDMAALYNATSRTMWGLCVCWVVFACATGYGGPVNKMLSWPALIPFSRLTYCAYLVHPVLMVVYYFSQRRLMHWYDLQVVYMFVGNLTLSYALAFVVSLAFEAPMMGLEKALFGREKNS